MLETLLSIIKKINNKLIFSCNIIYSLIDQSYKIETVNDENGEIVPTVNSKNTFKVTFTYCYIFIFYNV